MKLQLTKVLCIKRKTGYISKETTENVKKRRLKIDKKGSNIDKSTNEGQMKLNTEEN